MGSGLCGQTAVIDQFGERRDVGIRAINRVNDDGLIFLDRLQDDFATHQFPARNLTLLQRNGEIDVGILKNVAYRKIAFGIDSAEKRIEISNFFLRR